MFFFSFFKVTLRACPDNIVSQCRNISINIVSSNNSDFINLSLQVSEIKVVLVITKARPKISLCVCVCVCVCVWRLSEENKSMYELWLAEVFTFWNWVYNYVLNIVEKKHRAIHAW